MNIKLTFHGDLFISVNCKLCSGQVVRGNELYKNKIFIPIVTSKELHFKGDFQYISTIKFSLAHQKLRP